MSDADIPGGGDPPPLRSPQVDPAFDGPGKPLRVSRRTAGLAALVVLALVCAAVGAVSAVRLAGELNRGPTASELSRASDVELARRWEAWPAGRIFPATIGYVPDVGGDERATRVGVDPGEGCADAFDPAARRAMAQAGCRAVLRATYLDQLQGLVVTVGVIVFPDAASALRGRAVLPRGEAAGPGLRAYGPPGSVAAWFGDQARQVAAGDALGPYVVAATLGYTDGRPARAPRDRQAGLSPVARQLVAAVLNPLGTPTTPRCGRPEWQC